jgi:hypothetical protein
MKNHEQHTTTQKEQIENSPEAMQMTYRILALKGKWRSTAKSAQARPGVAFTHSPVKSPPRLQQTDKNKSRLATS